MTDTEPDVSDAAQEWRGERTDGNARQGESAPCRCHQCCGGRFELENPDRTAQTAWQAI